jgi:hypothetical protein
MGANTCNIHVGRLLEIRVSHGFAHAEDVEAQYRRLAELFGPLPNGKQVVIAADWRACPVMSPEGASGMGRVLKDFNAKIERSGILGSNDSPTAVMQFFRVIREGGHPDRKFFSDTNTMFTFLDERLTPEEAARMREFIREAQ